MKQKTEKGGKAIVTEDSQPINIAAIIEWKNHHFSKISLMIQARLKK